MARMQRLMSDEHVLADGMALCMQLSVIAARATTRVRMGHLCIPRAPFANVCVAASVGGALARILLVATVARAFSLAHATLVALLPDPWVVLTPDHHLVSWYEDDVCILLYTRVHGVSHSSRLVGVFKRWRGNLC